MAQYAPTIVVEGNRRVEAETVRSYFRIVPGDGPETGSVQLMTTPLSPIDSASIEVSYKPFMNVLWLGGFLMATGCFLPSRRR